MWDRNRPLAWSSVSIDPRARAAAARQRDGGATANEIVPLLANEHGEKFGPVQPVQLTPDPSAAGDQPGVGPKIDEPAGRGRLADQRGAGREEAMAAIAAHERAVGEELLGWPTSRARASGRHRACARGRWRGCPAPRSGRGPRGR